METDKLSNHKIGLSKKLRYTSPHNEQVDGYGFSKERISGAIHYQHSKKLVSNAASNLGNSTSKSVQGSDITELTKLRPRGSGTNLHSYTSETTSLQPVEVVYLERDILSNDTLQSFALLYGCTVNELKRANNLINEQDFFALRRIKIPVKKYGLLTEPEEEIKRRPVAMTSLLSPSAETSSSGIPNSTRLANQNSSSDVYHLPNEYDSFDHSMENCNLLPSNITPVVTKESTIDSNDTSKFLKSVDKEIRKTIKQSDNISMEKNEVLEEVVSSLGSVGYRPLPLPTSKTKECDGASWGIKWSTLLIIVLIIFVIILVLVGINVYVKINDHS